MVDLLAPLHILKLWQAEGHSPVQVRAMSDAWIAERVQYLKPYTPSKFRVIPKIARGAKLRSPEPNPSLTLKTCSRCKGTYTISEGFRNSMSKVCNFCQALKKRGPKPKVQVRIEAIGLDVLREQVEKLGTTKVDKLYRFLSGTMRGLFPDIHKAEKLPDDSTLTELAKQHTLKEIANLHTCSVERVRQRLLPLGIKALSPTQARINKAGGPEALYQEALRDGICTVARRHSISEEYLRQILPKVPRKPFPDEKRKLPAPARLAELYTTHTAKEIAQMYGSTRGSVFQAIFKAGIIKRKPGDTKQELLDFIEELGRPGVMPRVREFREHGKKTLLNRIRYLGGLNKVAAQMGLSMDGRGRRKESQLPEVPVATSPPFGDSQGSQSKQEQLL